MAQHYCEKCKKLKDEKEFYLSRRVDKYPPDGRMNICKACLTMHVDNWDPETYKPILEEVDVPYIEDEWNKVLAKYADKPEKLTGMTVLGKYLAKMRMKQYADAHWEDSERLAEEARVKKENAMRAQGMTQDEIQEHLNVGSTPARPNFKQPEADTPQYEETTNFDDDPFAAELTPEDKLMLQLKWGRGYRAEEWVRMEKLYQDMENSYDIQGAGMKDTLIMICKASVRANLLMDAGDLDGFQKITKVYNDLMKSAKLTAAQIKKDDRDEIDSVGELVAMCEEKGFIPRYYVSTPKDHVDRTLQDMQSYTRSLVTEELGLDTMIESAFRDIQADKEKEARVETDSEEDEARWEASLFDEGKDEDKDFTIDSYKEFQEFEESLLKQDEEDLYGIE